MPRDFGVTVDRSFNLEALVARTEGLFDELVGFEGEMLEPVLYEIEDSLSGERSAAIPRAEFGRVEFGYGRPSFSLDLRIGDLASASVSAYTDLHPGEPDAGILAGPDIRTGASYVLAVCAAIAVAELTAGVIDNGADHLVGRDSTDAQGALAALRSSPVTSGSIEERARQRLRPLPGYRDYGLIQERAP